MSTIIRFIIGLVNVQYAMCVPNTCSLKDVSMSNALLFQDLSLKTERAVEGGGIVSEHYEIDSLKHKDELGSECSKKSHDKHYKL